MNCGVWNANEIIYDYETDCLVEDRYPPHGSDFDRLYGWLASVRRRGDGDIAPDRDRALLRKDIELLRKIPIQYITPEAYDFPVKYHYHFRGKRPEMLLCVGETGLLGMPSILICGAREASRTAREQAYRCAQEAVDRGFVVISGYARGIDMAAHRGTLDAGGATVAILPYGLGRFRHYHQLRESFESDRFLAVSELPPSSGFSVRAAFSRNTLLAALADAVIVVEPGDSGGSWYTAEKAHAMSKPLFYADAERPSCRRPMEALGARRIASEGTCPDLTAVFEECEEAVTA